MTVEVRPLQPGDNRQRCQSGDEALVRFGIELAERMQADVGCVGVVVDAKPAAVGFYRNLGFEPIEVVEDVPRTAWSRGCNGVRKHGSTSAGLY